MCHQDIPYENGEPRSYELLSTVSGLEKNPNLDD
jgi:hypothetical protein